MKKASIFSLFIALLIIASCSKPAASTTGTATEQQVLTAFADTLVNPNYQDIQAKANILNQSIITLSTGQTDANLAASQTAWRNVRTSWESTEGFLFGPVEDNNYDPATDTWPVDRVELDSLLASSKGYHAIEYVIFGVGSTRTAAQITPRMMTYLVSMGQSLYNTTTALRNSWDPAQVNFSAQVINAGNGSTYFTTRKAAFEAIVASMADICDEVGTSKMQTPLGANPPLTSDSTQDESSFSHNSTADFTHNITGIKNAYFCTYNNGPTGHSLHQLVAANNLALDNQITSAINSAIGALNNINSNYEIAIYTNVQQMQAAQAQIAALKVLIDGPTNSLNAWVIQYVHD
jgi:putative iron-regulated protein